MSPRRTRSSISRSIPGGEGYVISRENHRDGSISFDGRFIHYRIGVSVLPELTNSWISTPFWEYVSGAGPIFDSGRVLSAPLFDDPHCATGLPATDSSCARVRVGGVVRHVLIQCFERRCLTYTPANLAAWQVEAVIPASTRYQWRHGPTSWPANSVPISPVDVNAFGPQRALARDVPTARSLDPGVSLASGHRQGGSKTSLPSIVPELPWALLASTPD